MPSLSRVKTEIVESLLSFAILAAEIVFKVLSPALNRRSLSQPLVRSDGAAQHEFAIRANRGLASSVHLILPFPGRRVLEGLRHEASLFTVLLTPFSAVRIRT